MSRLAMRSMAGLVAWGRAWVAGPIFRCRCETAGVRIGAFQHAWAVLLPPVFIRAWEELVDRARINAVYTALVQGVAGGPAGMAIEIPPSP